MSKLSLKINQHHSNRIYLYNDEFNPSFKENMDDYLKKLAILIKLELEH